MKQSNVQHRVRGTLYFLLMTVLFSLVLITLAAVAMVSDPDGQHLRAWLHTGRWTLSGWRLTLYVALAIVWWKKVRPRLVTDVPASFCRVLKVEWLAVLFILATECVSWASVL